MGRWVGLFAVVVLIWMPVSGRAEKPGIAVAAPVISGDIHLQQREAITVFFQGLLEKSYRAIAADRYRAAAQVVFREIRAEQCTEGYCIYKIKQILKTKRLIILELAKTKSLLQLKITMVRDEDRLVEEDICSECSSNQVKAKLRQLFDQIRRADLGMENESFKTTGSPVKPQSVAEHIRENTREHLVVAGLFLASAWELFDESARYNQLASRNAELRDSQQQAVTSVELAEIRLAYESNQNKMEQNKYQMNLMQVIMASLIVVEFLMLSEILGSGPQGTALKPYTSMSESPVSFAVKYREKELRTGFKISWRW